MTTSLMSTTTNLNTAAFPTSSDGIVEPPGRSVIFLVEIEGSDNQKRDISKRATGGFVGQDNPDVCTFAATYNLAEGQLFTGGVPIYYSGEEFKELGGDGPPVSGSITRTFDTDGRTLVFRNSELPNGEAGFCQDSSGQVYLTFTAEPSNCVPVTLAVYDVAQCQDGRLVGFDTSTTPEIVSETSTVAEVSSRSASSEESMTAEATISTDDNSLSSSQTEPSGRSSEASTFEASTTVSSEVIDSSTSTPTIRSSILSIESTTGTLSSMASEVLGSTIDTSTGSDLQPSSEVTGFASFSTFSSSEQITPNTSTTTSDSSSEMDESETQATTTESSREIDTTETEETTTESSFEIDTTTVESSFDIYTSTSEFSSETEATTTQSSFEVDTSTTEATTTTSQETTSADTTTTDLAMTTTSEFSSDIDTSSTEATTTTGSETTTSTTADTTTDATSTTALESSSEIYTSTTEPSSETETTTAQSSSEIDTSTTEETTTTSLETSTADTTTDLTTTTSSAPEPDECSTLSDPYNVGGFDFDLSCNTAVTSFGNSIGQAQANSFSQCVLFCAESPSCGGVQYHKSNMLCDGYTLITGTTGNNLFHVAIKLYPTTTTSAEPTTSIEP
ncbi:hypothetical protein BHE90_002703 [Fusarium euwallaceae]|uniref:DUF7908 domain-containing protein n=1 Tax=Fusarium euwallaceae TaxID=1147111 RepID=A0A430M4J3_9HYPO|nr:hypothetical protein BHE90_002703 [Fusarium euwallaceae]